MKTTEPWQEHLSRTGADVSPEVKAHIIGLLKKVVADEASSAAERDGARKAIAYFEGAVTTKTALATTDGLTLKIEALN
jgi:hypothetical protein